MTFVIKVKDKIRDCLNDILNIIFLDEVVKILQEGAFLNNVLLVCRISSRNNLYVLKMIITNEQNRKLLEKEITVGMFKAKECPFLVSYLEVFEEGGNSCILMDYYEKGDLQEYVEKGNIIEEKVDNSFLQLTYLFFRK
jgi:serine/threonine protein kinase